MADWTYMRLCIVGRIRIGRHNDTPEMACCVRGSTI